MTVSRRRPWTDGRIVLPVVLLVLTTGYLLSALGITTAYDDAGVGPSFFPVVLAVVMYAALAAVLFQALREPRGAAAPLRLKDPIKVVLLTAAYIALFRPLGYFIATTLYVWSLFLVFDFGSRNHLWRVVGAILIAIAAWLLFDVAFGVRLPKFLDLI